MKTKREQIIELKEKGIKPSQIAKIVKCNISLIYYHTNEKYRRKNIDRLIKLKKDNKTKALEYKGGKCIKCGYNKCKAALVFHHKNPQEKEIRIGGVPHMWSRLKKELDKTILLCCRCHTELHDGCWTKDELTQYDLKYYGYEATNKNILPPSKNKSNWIKINESHH